jgi:hypothetical protein
VQPAVDVGVFHRIGLRHRVDHDLRLLRRGAVVEIDERLAVHLAREDREVLADLVHVVGHEPFTTGTVTPISVRMIDRPKAIPKAETRIITKT